MWAELTFVLSQSTRLTDRQTRWLSHGYTVRCIIRIRAAKIKRRHQKHNAKRPAVCFNSI